LRQSGAEWLFGCLETTHGDGIMRKSSFASVSHDNDKPKPSAFSKALGLAARRERSARDLKRKLAQGGYAREESEAALERLQALDFQNDTRFAGVLLRSRAGQGHGPRRIAAELRTHGLDDAAIRAQFEAEDLDWAALARDLYRRRFGGRPAADRAEGARRAAFLLRRGFDAATVRSLTHADDVDDSSDDFD
jgi:regulatory protein